MKITMKIREFELQQRDTIVITANMEDFKDMLDGISPHIITDYLAETIKNAKKREEVLWYALKTQD